ncbi:MAG: hypothetical protein AAF604_20400 [Acidobacteriota bacterium]
MNALKIAVLASFAAGLFAASTPASAQWVARHGLSPSRYQSEFNKWTRAGYRLTDVTGYSENGKERYAAVWEKKSGPRWVARHGLSSSAYQAEFDRRRRAGYRLTHVSGYCIGTRIKFAAIWEKRSGPAYVARHNLTSSRYQAEFNKWTRAGYRLAHVSGYSDGSRARFAAIWEKRSGPAYVARHNLTSSRYQAEFNKWTRAGYRPTLVSGYSVKGKHLYAAIWEKRGGGRWIARHGMTAAKYQSQFDDQTDAGYRPAEISAFGAGRSSRFAAIWEK